MGAEPTHAERGLVGILEVLRICNNPTSTARSDLQDLQAILVADGSAWPLAAPECGAIVLDEDHWGNKAQCADDIGDRVNGRQSATLAIEENLDHAAPNMPLSQSFQTGSSPS